MKSWFLQKNLKDKNLISQTDELLKLTKSKKALLFRNVKIKNFEELEIFSKKFGKLLNYGKKNYIEFKEVSLENELHYDGISSNKKKKIPKFIFFFVNKSHKQDAKKSKVKGKFLLLNSLIAAKNIPQSLKKKLKEKKLRFYGTKTYFKPNIKSDEFSFEKPFFEKINNRLNIRSHILSKHEGKLSKDKKFVISTEGWKMCFSKSTGEETFKLFKQINDHIIKKKNLKKIVFKKNDLLVVDNRYVFHGREKVSPPQKRHIIRLQII